MFKLLAVVILLSFSGMVRAFTCWDSNYPYNTDWMRQLDDSQLITDLSIPGTHDSAADCNSCLNNSSCKAVIEDVSTQAFGIDKQLDMGIRFFDMRLAYEKNDLGEYDLRFHHSVYYLEHDFGEACHWAVEFLKEHPSEFLVWLIREEHTDVSANTFWELITHQISYCNPDGFYLERTVPTVGEARGKIVVLAQNWSSEYPQGFHVHWANNTTYFEGSDGELKYVAEDHYRGPAEDQKITDIVQNLDLATLCRDIDCGDLNTLFFTFLSAESDPGNSPAAWAQYVNPKMVEWFSGGALFPGDTGGANGPVGPRRGIVAMDFAGYSGYRGGDLIDAVIAQNIYHIGEVPGGFGDSDQGAGLAVADIDGNGKPELFMLDIWHPGGTNENEAHYRIAYDLDSKGEPDRDKGYHGWSVSNAIPWWGDDDAGGGIAVKDLDGNSQPELIVFRIVQTDDPAGSNSGYYRIGWNMDKDGQGVTWSVEVTPVPSGFGDENQGAGLAVADIDGNGKPELFMFDILNNPDHTNQAYYRIAYDLDSNGEPDPTKGDHGWLAPQEIPWWGEYDAGGGIAVKDLNGNDKPELIVFWIDDPAGANHGYYRIGWDMNSLGILLDGWGPSERVYGWFGDATDGAGVVVEDLNANGDPELIVSWIDDPAGGNLGYYRLLFDELPHLSPSERP